MTLLDQSREEIETQADEAWVAVKKSPRKRPYKYIPNSEISPEELEKRRAKKKAYRERRRVKFLADPELHAAHREKHKVASRRHYRKDLETSRERSRAALERRTVGKNEEELKAHRAQLAEISKRKRQRAKALKAAAEQRFSAARAGTTLSACAAARTDPVYGAIWKALGGLPNEVKEDAASEALLILLDRRAATPEEAAKLGAKRYWKLFTKFGWVSLDEPAFDGGPARHEMLIAEGTPAW